MDSVASLLKKLHITYKNIAIYEQALTHPHYMKGALKLAHR